MIEVFLYNNGFEIKGHSDLHICHAVGLLAWSSASSIKRCDKNSYFDTMDGLTWSLHDTTNQQSNYVYQEFKWNLEEWAESEWQGKVKITMLDETLHKTDKEKANSSP